MSSTDKISSTAVNKSAKFLDVEPNTKTILVNVGYLLMRWTNGRWKNTVHRVSEPPLANRTNAHESDDLGLISERYSIAFFSFPDAETNVESLHSCCSDQAPKRWGPINAGEYLLRKRTVLYS
jgi:isopenicillin N synthase-like dioxygenase